MIHALKKDNQGKRHLINWFSIKNILNLFIGILIIVAFIESFFVNMTQEQIFGKDYQDLCDTFNNYNVWVLINSWILLLVFFRSIIVAHISSSLNVYLHTIDLGMKTIMYYVAIIILLLIGKFLLSYNLFGPFMALYRNMQLNIVSNLLFSMGYGDIEDFLYVSPIWTIAYLLVYFFIIMFFLYSAFLSIIIDSYRIAEFRQRNLNEAMAKDNSYKPHKIWISQLISLCRKQKKD